MIEDEAAVEVGELGTGVDKLKRGDRVVALFVASCGHCVRCREGRRALCETSETSSVA